MWDYKEAVCHFCRITKQTTERTLDGVPIRACDACLCELALAGRIRFADLPPHMEKKKE
jgi:hypothetical protein